MKRSRIKPEICARFVPNNMVEGKRERMRTNRKYQNSQLLQLYIGRVRTPANGIKSYTHKLRIWGSGVRIAPGAP